jgi:hypothetical protein
MHRRSWLSPAVLAVPFVLVQMPLAQAAESLDHSKGTRPHTESRQQTDPAPFIEEGLIPGDWVVTGKVKSVRSAQVEVDIGNPEPLYLPLKSAVDKGFEPKPGDRLEIVLNDHYAIVDYHPAVGKEQEHVIIKGQLALPLTVGMDKATLRSGDGELSLPVASRARSKIAVIPLKTDAIFLVDETGQIVDAQIMSERGERESARNQKPPVTGAHRRVEATYLGMADEETVRVKTKDGKVRILPFRPPLDKLDRLKDSQKVTLLVDSEGYIEEIATPDVPVR